MAWKSQCGEDVDGMSQGAGDELIGDLVISGHTSDI